MRELASTRSGLRARTHLAPADAQPPPPSAPPTPPAAELPQAERVGGMGEARLREDQAVQALVSTEALDDALRGPRAMQELRAWISAISERQRAGQPTSLMQHLALVHLVRSGFLAKFGCDRELSRTVEASVRQGWSELTGQEATSYAQVLSTRLPRSVLRHASRDEALFHQAVFALPPGGAASAPAHRRGAAIAKQAAAAFFLVGVGLLHGSHPVGQVLAGLIEGYAITSVVENLVHRHLLHLTPEETNRLKQSGGPTAQFILRARRLHALHHGLLNGQKYSTAVSEEWKRLSHYLFGAPRLEPATAATAAQAKRVDHLNRYGLGTPFLVDSELGAGMAPEQVNRSLCITTPLALAAAFLSSFDLPGYLAATAGASLTTVTTKLFHPLLHEPLEGEVIRDNAFNRWLVDTPFFRWISRHHFVHHVTDNGKAPPLNISLFNPFAGWLLGSGGLFDRSPSIEELARMREMDLPR